MSYVFMDQCTGCEECITACPTEAIKVKEEQDYEIDDAKCTKCGACQDACPEDAIQLDEE
ncbi:MAG: 4Fe-4S binding protein [Bacillota bacterium]